VENGKEVENRKEVWSNRCSQAPPPLWKEGGSGPPPRGESRRKKTVGRM
jgi:hypothetical protein